MLSNVTKPLHIFLTIHNPKYSFIQLITLCVSNPYGFFKFTSIEFFTAVLSGGLPLRFVGKLSRTLLSVLVHPNNAFHFPQNFQMPQLQLVLPSSSCFTVYSSSLARSKYLCFYFLSFSHSGLLEWQNSLDGKFSDSC